MTRTYPLLTTAEVAGLLRISPRTVRLWAECSELPALRVGKQWRFRAAEIEKFLAVDCENHPYAPGRPSLTVPLPESRASAAGSIPAETIREMSRRAS